MGNISVIFFAAKHSGEADVAQKGQFSHVKNPNGFDMQRRPWGTFSTAKLRTAKFLVERWQQ